MWGFWRVLWEEGGDSGDGLARGLVSEGDLEVCMTLCDSQGEQESGPEQVIVVRMKIELLCL